MYIIYMISGTYGEREDVENRREGQREAGEGEGEREMKACRLVCQDNLMHRAERGNDGRVYSEGWAAFCVSDFPRSSVGAGGRRRRLGKRGVGSCSRTP